MMIAPMWLLHTVEPSLRLWLFCNEKPRRGLSFLPGPRSDDNPEVRLRRRSARSRICATLATHAQSLGRLPRGAVSGQRLGCCVALPRIRDPGWIIGVGIGAALVGCVVIALIDHSMEKGTEAPSPQGSRVGPWAMTQYWHSLNPQPDSIARNRYEAVQALVTTIET